MKKSLITVLLLILATFAFASSVFADPASDPWLTVMPQPGHAKPNGKTVVLISGDEEYRSEESMPQLARILALHPAANRPEVREDGAVQARRKVLNAS